MKCLKSQLQKIKKSIENKQPRQLSTAYQVSQSNEKNGNEFEKCLFVYILYFSI